ncbi:hypothetical protein [Candidatus Poriferisodalis sp.]|uniref:hypothetical protein n=1 Tax=Candidatus Poriferisodalis sp. TaxID=3101277 RepID=UPI003D145469
MEAETIEAEALESELRHAARVLLTEVRPVAPGDRVLITADSQADQQVARATEAAARALGAEPTVLTYPTGTPVGPAPPAVATAALQAGHWINFSVGYHLYSAAYEAALANGCVYVELTGMDVDMMIRTIGRVDNALLDEVKTLLYRKSQAVSTLRLTSPAGCDVTMTVDPAGDPFWEDPPSDRGWPQMLGGQSGCMVVRESANGTLVFDGAVWPPASLGLLKRPIVMTLVDGYATQFSGGREAELYEQWLRSVDSAETLMFDHFCYGFNPGVRKPTGRILEDERVFGCVQIGIGATELGSPVHSDGVVLRPTVWLDDQLVQADGAYVDPEIAALTDQLIA